MIFSAVERFNGRVLLTLHIEMDDSWIFYAYRRLRPADLDQSPAILSRMAAKERR